MTATESPRIGRRPTLALAGACLLLALAVSAGPAFASTECSSCSPWWRLDSSAVPTYLPPGDKEAKIIVTAGNLGDAPVTGSDEHPITITATLPPGLKATAITGKNGRGSIRLACPTTIGSGSTLTCRTATSKQESEEVAHGKVLEPYELLEVEVAVTVEEPLGTVTSLPIEARVGGGEGPSHLEPEPKAISRSVSVNGAPTPYGVEAVKVIPEDEGGAEDGQAGSHPFQLTTALDLNEAIETGNVKFEEPLRSVPAQVRDLQFNLPRGLIGNPQAVPQCSASDFKASEGSGTTNACAADTVVGVATVTVNEPATQGVLTHTVPVFNVEPAQGEPARFGFVVAQVHVFLDAAVRSGEDYGVVVSVRNASQLVQVLSTEVTLWGVPGEESHDGSRGWACVEGGSFKSEGEACAPPQARNEAPFLTLPTLCSEPLKTTVLTDSWLEPGRRLSDEKADPTDPRWKTAETESPALKGCEGLPFSPEVKLAPEERSGSTPTGMKVDVEVPQGPTLTAGQLGEADVKDTTVTLPEGMQLNEGAADGLLGCSALEVGFNGFEAGLPEAAQTENDHFSANLPTCPDQSKVGTVRITTPLLANKLEGNAYLGLQDTNPFQPPLVLYLIAYDKESGVLVKLAGKVTPDPQTGQLVSRFEDTPPLPFEDLEVNFFAGPRASVATPPGCGTHTTAASLTPWSGNPAPSESSFTITSGPGGSACPGNPQPFAPSFRAGTTNVEAGAYTPFSLTVNHADGDQALAGISMTLPTGLAAKLASVTPCPEPQAATSSCGADSLIGHATESAGLGPDPITLTAPVYLTGPYKGAPFGLLVVTHAKAGPFDLGLVPVRSTIKVNPYTAAVTISSDPLPTIVKGVPVQLKALNVIVDRPEFQFNPTSCNPLKIEGTLAGSQGTHHPVSSSFQLKDCNKLAFKPTFTARTEAHTSKLDGASLRIVVTSGAGQANIGKTKVLLPTQLPSRLSTLQKACVDKVFEANPAACPEGSNIGSATIHTPVFKKPLSGPAYLVSHGSAAFPDVEFVLQGEGVTIILDGLTDIKNGITTSTFNALPDAPFTFFETVLPEGPHSVLGANGSLCSPTKTVTERKRVARRVHGRVVHVIKSVTRQVPISLSMPTILTGQNGVVIEQSTKIEVTGCQAVKSFKKAKPKPKKKSKKKKK
jgi:hypothetical protein